MTKVEKAMLRLASRPCGMSYLSACRRDREMALQLKRDGFLILRKRKHPLYLNGVEVREFIYFITEKGTAVLNDDDSKKECGI